MKLRLRRDLPVRLGDQLQAQIRALIDGGALRPGDALPSARALAEHEGVNPNTVAAAYAGLEKEGFLVQRKRAGTRVAAEPPRSPEGALLAGLAWQTASRAQGLGLPAAELVRAVAAQAALAGKPPRFRVALIADDPLQAEELRARAALLLPEDAELVACSPDNYASQRTHLAVIHPALTERLVTEARAPERHLDFGTDFPSPAD